MAAVRDIQQKVVIVVLGAFNPAIFQPSWFAQQGLVRTEEAEAAQVEIVHPEITVFQLDWLRFEATRDRLAVHSLRESHYEASRDLVAGVLDLLLHTPTRVVGVNHAHILECGSRDAFDNLGWTLVPAEPWASVLERPGVARLDQQGERTDGHGGYIRVKVEPIMDGGTKVLVEVNDHFAISEENSPSTSETIRNLLEAEWPAISKRASEILDHVKGLVT